MNTMKNMGVKLSFGKVAKLSILLCFPCLSFHSYIFVHVPLKSFKVGARWNSTHLHIRWTLGIIHLVHMLAIIGSVYYCKAHIKHEPRVQIFQTLKHLNKYHMCFGQIHRIMQGDVDDPFGNYHTWALTFAKRPLLLHRAYFLTNAPRILNRQILWMSKHPRS